MTRKYFNRYRNYNTREFTMRQVINLVKQSHPHLTKYLRVGYAHGDEFLLFKGKEVKIPHHLRTYSHLKQVSWLVVDQLQELVQPEVKSFLTGNEMSYEKISVRYRKPTVSENKSVFDEFYSQFK